MSPAKRRRERGAVVARKLKDKWRAKKWYKVYAPEMFDNVEIAETLADDVNKLYGRVVETTLHDLTGDIGKMHVKLLFQIDTADGTNAYTKFIGHVLTTDYVRRLTRRRHTKTDYVVDVVTKDGYKLRVKTVAIAEARVQTSQQSCLRRAMNQTLESTAKQKTFDEYVKTIVDGSMNTLLFQACKPIYPVKQVEIRRTEVLESPISPATTSPATITTHSSNKKSVKEQKKT